MCLWRAETWISESVGPDWQIKWRMHIKILNEEHATLFSHLNSLLADF